MERLAGRTILLWGWRRALVAFLAGALTVLSQAPYDFFAVCFISFPVLVWLLDGAAVAPPAGFLRRLGPAFAIGWWFGFGYFLAGLWWVGGALLVEADAYAWALPFAVMGLPAVLAIYYGLATAVARLMWSGDLGRIAALAFGFGLAEWLRMVLFTGFPWNAIGYAAMPVPLLMQSAAVTGLTGMNALAVLVFAMPALLASKRPLGAGMTIAAVLVAAHIAYGYIRLNAATPQPEQMLSVRIVQPNIPQTEKWDDATRDGIFRTLMNLSAQPPADGQPKPQLILWPETSVPYLFTDRPDALTAFANLLDDGQTLWAGAVRSETGPAGAEPIYYNSIVALNDKGEVVEAADKVHLVPFGEYLPLGGWLQALGLEKIVAAPMDFAAGAQRLVLTLPGKIRALPFICYEVIFPDLAAAGAASADLIVNVTNDAWFGDTPGPYQHFRQAQLRAVETGLPLLRAANTGISGAVDARGRVIDALALDVRGSVDLSIPAGRIDMMRIISPQAMGYMLLTLFGLTALAMKIRHHVMRI